MAVAQTGSFVDPAGGGTVTLTHAHARLLLILATLQTAAGFAAENRVLVGFARSDSQESCHLFQSRWEGLFGGQSMAVGRNGGQIGYASGGLNYSSTIDANFQVTTWDAAQIILTFGAQISGPGAVRYDYVVVCGTDVTTASDTDTCPTSAGVQTIAHGLGVKPSLALFAAGYTGHDTNGGCFSFGYADGAERQSVTAIHQAGTTNGIVEANPNDNQSEHREDAVITLLDDVTGAVIGRATYTADAVNIYLDWTIAPASAQDFEWIAAAGIPAHVVGFDAPVTPSTLRLDALAVVPSAMLFQSGGRVDGAGLVDGLRYSLGLSGGASHNASGWLGDEDGITANGNERATRHRSTTKCLVHAHPTGTSTGVVDAEAAVTATGDLATGGYVDLAFSAADATARRSSMLALGIASPSLARATITRARAWSAKPGDGLVANVRLYHRDAAGVAHEFTVSQIALDAKYAFLDGRVLELDDIERALSERGYLEGSSFTAVVADTDRQFRGFFGNANQRVLYNVEIAIEVQSIDEWRAGNIPLVVFRGNVSRYKALGGFRFALTCEDFLSLRTGKRVQLPAISAAFPNAPTAALETFGDLWYGQHSDGGSQTGVSPEPAAEAVSGATRITAILGDVGIGSLGLPAPAGLAFSEVGAGNLQAGDVIYVLWTRIAGGAESDADTLTGTPYTVVGSGVGVQVTGTPDGASAYRFYAGALFVGNVLFNQYLQTTTPATGVIFTKVPGLGTIDIADRTNITPGASGPSWTRQYVYARTARMTDGETVLVTTWNATSTPYRRPVRVVSEPVVGALEYHDWRREITGTWDRRWTVPVTSLNGAGDVVHDDSQLDDDPLLARVTRSLSPRGVVPGRHIGTVLDQYGFPWEGVAFAAHACAEIEDLFLEEGDVATRVLDSRFGVDYSAPDKPNHLVNFTDDWYDAPDGTRWTLAFVRGPDGQKVIDGTAVLRANLKGVEAAGDRSGTFLSQIPDQIAHFLDNYGLADDPNIYAGGLWGAIPTWQDGSPRRDATSFAQVLIDMAAAGLPADGAWAVQASGDRAPRVIDALAVPVVSMDGAYGPSREGGYRLVLEDPLDAPVSDVVYDADIDFDEDSDEWDDDTNESAFYNIETVQGSPRYSASGLEAFDDDVRTADTTVQDDYGVRVAEPDTVQLAALRSAYVLSLVGRRRVDRGRHPPRTMTPRTGLHAVMQEVGQVAEVTSSQGPGPDGYIAQQTRIRRIVTSFTTGKVQLALRELVTASYAGFNLEDFMAEFPLGGSLEHSPTISSTPQTVDPYDPPGAPAMVPWSILPASAVVAMVGRAFIEPGVTSVKVQLWDVALAVMVHETAAITTTSLPASNALNVNVPITKPGSTNKEYEMKLVVTGGAGKAVWAKAKIRVTV